MWVRRILTDYIKSYVFLNKIYFEQEKIMAKKNSAPADKKQNPRQENAGAEAEVQGLSV